MKISGDYDLCNADLRDGTYTVNGRAWKVCKTHAKTKNSCAVATTVVNGTTVRLEIPDEWRMGSLSVGRTVVEGCILNTDDIEDPMIARLAEDGYIAMHACMDALAAEKVTRREAENAAEQARRVREDAKRAAAIARLR